MKDADKNRDPVRAVKRAKADARCALRKLDLLPLLGEWASNEPSEPSEDVLRTVCEALDIDVAHDPRR